MPGLPTIDLTDVADDPDRARTESRRLDRACRGAGVFELVGHRVPWPLRTELFDVTREFFALPDAVKARVAQPAPDQVRGWSAFGSEGVAYSLDEESPADLKEKLDMGSPAHTGVGGYYDRVSAGPHLAPNLWPQHPPRLRAVWEDYYRHMGRVCAHLMSLCEIAWQLPAGWFVDKIDRPVSMLRALFYPPQIEPPLSGQLRAGVHSDYGAFTIIMAEDVSGGLQTLERGGEWSPVATNPGRLVVLTGDLLAEWTADEWPATLHRVVNPPRGTGGNTSRLAFAFYQEPNYDTHVDILPPFRGADWVAAEPVLTAGDHLRQKYLRQTTFGRPTAEH